MTYNGWHEISQSATSIWPLGLERRPGALFKCFCSDKNTWKDDTRFQSSERSLEMVFFKAHRVAKPNENFSELRRGKKEETGELIFALNVRVSLVRKWSIKFPTHTCFTEKLVAQLVPENSREHQRKIGKGIQLERGENFNDTCFVTELTKRITSWPSCVRH